MHKLHTTTHKSPAPAGSRKRHRDACPEPIQQLSNSTAALDFPGANQRQAVAFATAQPGAPCGRGNGTVQGPDKYSAHASLAGPAEAHVIPAGKAPTPTCKNQYPRQRPGLGDNPGLAWAAARRRRGIRPARQNGVCATRALSKLSWGAPHRTKSECRTVSCAVQIMAAGCSCRCLLGGLQRILLMPLSLKTPAAKSCGLLQLSHTLPK